MGERYRSIDELHARKGQYLEVKKGNRLKVGAKIVQVAVLNNYSPGNAEALVEPIVRIGAQSWTKVIGEKPDGRPRTKVIRRPWTQITKLSGHPVRKTEKLFRKVNRKEAHRLATRTASYPEK